MRFFIKYIREHLCTIIVCLLCYSAFPIVLLLYNTPVAVILYPTAISLVIASLYGVYRLIKAYKKNQLLKYMRKLPANLTDCISQYNKTDDANYRELINLLEQKNQSIIAELMNKYDDMIEYYTVWAHQIKTPIASMRLTLQNEDSPLSRRLNDDLVRIEQYVDMVMTYLRLDSDSTDYVFRETDIDSIIRNAVRKLSGQFISKGLRLDYSSVNVKAVTDEKWLSFVVEQILTNAVKYTFSGSISITWREPDTIVIADTGMGIAADDIPRIFEKGYTGYHGRSDKKASGLGLYLCKRICDRLGHSITVKSEPDKGSEFSIHLTGK